MAWRSWALGLDREMILKLLRKCLRDRFLHYHESRFSGRAITGKKWKPNKLSCKSDCRREHKGGRFRSLKQAWPEPDTWVHSKAEARTQMDRAVPLAALVEVLTPNAFEGKSSFCLGLAAHPILAAVVHAQQPGYRIGSGWCHSLPRFLKPELNVKLQ